MPINNKPISTKRLIIILLLFTCIITMFRFLWLHYHETPEQHFAKKGVLDLSLMDLSEKETISLEGEWALFPNEFVNPKQEHDSKYFTSIPETEDFFTKHGLTNEGYASYQLEVVPPENIQYYGIQFKELHTAAKVYINGELVAENGKVSASSNKHKGKLGAFTAFFTSNEEKLNIVVHMSNYDLPYSNGIVDKIVFGSNTAIDKETSFYYSLQLITVLTLLLHSLYAFSLFFFGINQKQLIYFGSLVFIAAISTAFDDGRIILSLLTLNPAWMLKILYMTFYTSAAFSLLFVHSIISLNKRILKTLVSTYIILSILMLIIPNTFVPVLLPIGLIMNIIGQLYLIIAFIKRLKKVTFDKLFILLSMIAICSNVIWGTAINLNIVEITYYPFDLLIAIFLFSFYLFMHYNQLAKQQEVWTKQLLQFDKTRDEFLATTSHELRNPLHGIINIAQSTLENDHLPKSSKDNLQLLIDVGKRMSYTLNDLSTITQLNEGKITLQRTTVDLHTVASLVMQMLEYMKEGKVINLKLNIPSNFPNIYADENRIVQILFNLVHNAIKFTEQGSIVVDATYSSEMAKIYVIDTGIGMPKETDMEQLFKKYERGSEQQANTGIGIGLNVSKQLVELHGGTITYESSHEGTTFTFTIPLVKAKKDSSLSDAKQSALGEIASTVEAVNKSTDQDVIKTKPAILVVDDDPVNVKVVKQTLTKEYNVFTAYNGKEALKIIQQHEIDLIISDVMMPNMSGYELTKQIRQQYTLSELPVLLVTARDFQEDIQTAFISGANDYLVKPVNTLELKTRVNMLTKLKQSVKELLRLEAAWLQAQIHPHFLFNTLNSIASLAEIDINRMVALLEAFGTYLRESFSLSNIESKVPLKNELELTYSYIHIEKERFGERLNVELDIDSGIDILIPPLSIQPLVENAILHGVLPKISGGTIGICVKEREDDVAITIKDDGVGMSEEMVKSLLDLEYKIEDGIGIKNTNRRLSQLYGSGLTISSKRNEGTTIQFFIPKT